MNQESAYFQIRKIVFQMAYDLGIKDQQVVQAALEYVIDYCEQKKLSPHSGSDEMLIMKHVKDFFREKRT